LGASGTLLLAPFLQTIMPKPISVILHDNKIIASFACRDEAIKEFKKLEISNGEISLHLLDRPDRKKKATKTVTEKPAAPAKPVKQSVIGRIVSDV
jgi:hypothetical protein